MRVQWRCQDARLRGLGHSLLGRHVHVLSPARALALMMGDQRGDSRLGAGVQVRLWDTYPDRWAVVVAREHEGATSREDDEIAIGIVRLRSILAKGGDGDVDQCRVEDREVAIAKPMRGQRPRSVGFDEKVRASNQTIQDGLPVTAGDI